MTSPPKAKPGPLTRSHLARVALAAWVNVKPDQLPQQLMWIEHPNDLNRQAWGRVVQAIIDAHTEAHRLLTGTEKSDG
jgi:hypothetical protein